ncbi:MAG: condensation domain-containing protein, partial [Acidobacteriota bacterium]
MPLTAGRKVDRQALLGMEVGLGQSKQGFDPPQTPSEEILAGIWAKVLGVGRVGRQDHFFELGGHSLLATQVVSRIRKALGQEIPLRALFEAPRLEALSRLLDDAQRREDSPAAPPPLTPIPFSGQPPLSFAQQRLWFLHQMAPLSPAYNMPSALSLTGQLDVAALQASFTAIVSRHQVLRTSFPQRDGVPIQNIAPPAPFPLPIVDLSDLPEHHRTSQARQLADQEAILPFNLSQGPVIRGRLIQLSGGRGKTENGERRTEEGNDSGFRVPGSGFWNPESEIRDLEPEAWSLEPEASLPSSVLRPPSSVLLLTLHHIVSDGWSMGLLVHELSILYRTLCNGEPPIANRQLRGRRQEAGGRRQKESVVSSQLSVVSSDKESGASASGPYSLQPKAYSLLPSLPIQYSDFALWQRSWLRGEVLDEQLRYWRRQLAGVPRLELPTDRPHPPVQTFRGAAWHFDIPKVLADRLQKLGRDLEATRFISLMSAFGALLSRYSGQTAFAVGSPIANRNRHETESLIGFFVNTLALRLDLSGDPDFEEVVKRVRRTALDAYAHQDLPFEQLVEDLHPERSLSRPPLVQVVLALQNAPQPPLELPGLQLGQMAFEHPAVRFDLELHVWELEEGFEASLIYNSGLFDAATMQRLARRFVILMQGLTDDPHRNVCQLPLLTEAERHQTVVAFNDSAAEAARQCVHHQVQSQALERPDAIALEAPARSASEPASLSADP